MTLGAKRVIIENIMEDFVRLREILTPVGVYALLWQGTIIYVGKSTNLLARLSMHYTKMQRHLKGLPPYEGHHAPPIVFDDVWVKWLPCDKHDREEVRLIQKYQPRYNVAYNRPKVDLSHIPAFQELLAKARKHPSVMRRTIRPTPAPAIQAYKNGRARRLVVIR